MSEQPKRWPRLTIRAIMLLVILVAVGLYLGIAAVDVYRTKESHVHVAVDTRTPTPSVAIMGGMEPPFWPRYLRRLAGLPWRGLAFCGPTPGLEGEECEFAHPEMVVKFGKEVAYQASPVQARKLEEILKRQAK